MIILVTGASGGLGHYVVSALCARGISEVLAPSRKDLDITDDAQVQRYMARWLPDSTIHLAAMTDVARCSREPREAIVVNMLGTQHLARKSRGFVFMSTNDLFSGIDGDGPFDEFADLSPRGVYAWTKLAAEQAVLAVGGAAVRANFFTRYSRTKLSFVAHVLENARACKPIPCYSNVRATPVFAGTLAEVLVDKALSFASGVFHVCSSDVVDRTQQARMILDAYGLSASGILERDADAPSNGCLKSVRGDSAGTVEREVAKMVACEPLEDVLCDGVQP